MQYRKIAKFQWWGDSNRSCRSSSCYHLYRYRIRIIYSPVNL